MIYDTVIIGGGTAGLTAAVYLKRANKSVIILEKDSFGGQILFTPKIENYPALPMVSGAEYCDALFSQAESLGAEYSLEDVQSITKTDSGFKVVTDDGEYLSKTVILATGVRHRHLGLDREDDFAGEGVSYCATCDGSFFKDKIVAVNGGGSTALTDALYLSGICKTVYLIHRRECFRAEQHLVDRVNNTTNIKLLLNKTVTKLDGDDSLKSIGVTDKNTCLTESLDVDGLFVAIGMDAANDVFKNLVNLDDCGFIIAGEDTLTSTEGVFAAGDCRTKKVRQLTTAAADGSSAAVAAAEYLSK